MRSGRVLLPILILFLGGVGRATAAPLAVEFSAVNAFVVNGADVSVGWSFTTNHAISVVALDAFDPTGTGNVRLYDSTGTTLASATVLNTDPTVGSPVPFFSHAIPSVTLAAGQTYFVAQDASDSTTTFNLQVAGLTTNPLITFGAGVLDVGLGVNPLTDFFSGAYNPAYFGPNFNFVSAPEPSTFTLCGLGGLGLLLAARRRRKA